MAKNGKPFLRKYMTLSLQGDYTRTGERNLAGLVKDGMNSANRYVTQIDYFLLIMMYLNQWLLNPSDSHESNFIWKPSNRKIY